MMYKSMGSYGLLDNRLSLVLSMIALASPYAIWVMKQASDKLPFELDEAPRVDGASSWQILRLVYLPLVATLRCCRRLGGKAKSLARVLEHKGRGGRLR